jgi:hypothetical protein
MKKMLLLLPILSISLTAMEISLKKKFVQEIKPNMFQARINIVVKKQSEKDIITKLSHHSTYFNATSNIEKI